MGASEIAVTFSNTEQKLIKFLGQGVSQVAAADAVGCSESFVSQCMARNDFAAAVAEIKGARTAQYATMDELADNIQLVALQRLEKLVPVEYKVGNLLNIVDKMDKMSRKNNATSANTAVTTVTLTLPPALQNYAVSVDLANRVIQIGGTTMLPASSRQVADMAEVLKQKGRDDVRGPERQILSGSDI